ncbi:hypothetical protein PAMP_015885 [Pampus punctatissimus]
MDETVTDSSVNELSNTNLLSLLTSNNNEVFLLKKLQGLVTNIKWSSTDVAELFDALLKRVESTATNDPSNVHSWMMKMLHCIEINYNTPSWKYKSKKTVIELVQDKTVTDDNLKECLADDKEKQLDEILEEIRQQKFNQIDEKLLDDVRDIVSSVDKDLTSRNDGSQRSGLKKDLLKLCQAAEKTHFRPRLTQIVSLCLMALSKTGWLIQVGTGEGKSCIVAMFAAFRAMRGEKVDIMSSSSVLAERDVKEWQTFYKALGISVSFNTNKGVTDLKECYECQVVYGTAKEFAGDWLQQQFHRKDIFGQRKFQCAIVDEVDSLMLDKGHHVVYLSSDMPALQHLNPLLALIWATVNQYEKTSTGTIVGQKYPFHQVVLENINTNTGKDVDEFTILQMAEDTGILTKGSVKDLRMNPSLYTKNMSSITVNQLAELFQAAERLFPSCKFVLHCINDHGALKELNKRPQNERAEKRVPLLLTSGGFCQYMYSDQDSVLRATEAEIKRVLHFTPCELSRDNSSCYIPGFLSDLVDSKLKVWIRNAFQAQTMTSDHEYIIERHGVVPVDYSCTGVVENFMKWTDGLQQFLEMKHKSKLSDMTAITNFMSSVGLLQKYGDQIYGISGTLGQQAEIETLQKIYDGIKTCQIPSFKRAKLFEVEGVITEDESDWIKTIRDVVAAQIKGPLDDDKRAVLIICETINRAKVLNNALRDEVPQKKLYVNNNMDNTAIFAKKLKAGEVIIATNLAGRGTDLQVSDDVKKAGGLFVVQTFLPKNARVEAQAFGRTARQGSPGSAQLIICSSHLSEPLQLLVRTKELQSLLEYMTSIRPVLQDIFLMQFRLYQKGHRDEESINMSTTLSHILTENTNFGIKIAKKVRDDLVTERLTSYLECHIPKIKKKEELFSQYLDTLDGLYKSRNENPSDADLSALNYFWGMWLLMNVNINDSIMDLKSRLKTDLNSAMEKLRQRESPSSNLHHYTAFGNELREKGHLAESIKMYTKAIQEDHCWAAIAYYNRAFAYLTQKNRCQDQNCIEQALEDLQNALKSIEFYCKQIEVTHRYSTQQNKDSHSDSTTRLDEHIIARYTVLLLFKGHINEAIKKLDRARGWIGRHVKVDESPVYCLAPLPLLLLLSLTQSVTLIRNRDPLQVHQLISQPSFDIFHELKCLESLGLTHVYTLDTLSFLSGFFSKIWRTTC